MKLTEDRIVAAGLAVIAEAGYHGLSMRLVADRLDARAGSLYYHVRNKEALLRLLADRVAAQAHDAASAALAALPDPDDWVASVEAQASTLRRTIRAHPGGAVLLADSPKVLSTGALSLMERLLGTLADAGVPVAHRGVAADAILSHVTGFVLQEQSESRPELTEDGLAELRARFPRTVGQPPMAEDEKFTRSIRLLCAGIASLLPDRH